MAKRKYWTRPEEVKVLDMAKKGVLLSKIGEEVGREKSGIKSRLERLGYSQAKWSDKQRIEFGMRFRQAEKELSDEQKEEIRKDCLSGMSVKNLLEKYKIGYSKIQKIKANIKVDKIKSTEKVVKFVEPAKVIKKIDREFLKDIPVESGVVYRFETKKNDKYRLEPVTVCRRLTAIKNALFFKTIDNWQAVRIIKITGNKRETILTITAEELKNNVEFRDSFKLGVET